MTSTKKATEKKPNNSFTSSDAQKSLLFQAIGVISGSVSFEEESNFTTITIQKKKYPLRYIPSKSGLLTFDALKEQVRNTQNSHQRLKVYPKVSTRPEAPESYQVEFDLVNFDRSNLTEGALVDFGDLEFKLAGLWESIPFFKLPCISVFRNFNHARLKFLNRLKIHQQIKFMKPSHVPLFWKDALVEPFKFDPSIPREEQGKQYFITLKAKFSVHKNIFVFDSLLSLPSEEPPNFFKPNYNMGERTSKAQNFGQEQKFELQTREKNTLALPAVQLTNADIDLRELLEAHPDATLIELCELFADKTGNWVGRSAMCSALKKLGLNLKKAEVRIQESELILGGFNPLLITSSHNNFTFIAE